MQVPFLSKYRERFGGQSHWITPCRDYIIDLFCLALRHSTPATNMEGYKTTLGEIPDVL